jgi:hypothetical protein
LGEIVAADDEKFRQVALSEIRKGGWVGGVSIYSPGGHTIAAMHIGEQIRILRAQTGAPQYYPTLWQRHCNTTLFPDGIYYNERTGEGDRRCECASACFLIWAAGYGRSGGVLGVHRMRFTDPSFAGLQAPQAAALYDRVIADGQNYLRRMGIPENIIQLNYGTDSASLRYLTRDEIRPMIGLPPGLDELKIARCGHTQGSLTDAEQLKFKECVEQILEENARSAAQEYLKAYGN